MSFSNRFYLRVCCAVLFFVAASASFSGFYEKNHFREAGVAGADLQSSFEGMLNGTALRPFVYRQLLPDIANWAGRVTPQPVQDRIYAWFYQKHEFGNSQKIVAFAKSATAQDPHWFYRYLIFYLATFFSVWLSVFGMYLVCRAVGLSQPVAVFAPIVVILLMPYIQAYAYDCAELAFLSFAVWAALRFNWWYLLPLAAIAAWNKESFLFFVPALYPFFRQRASRLSSVIGVLALCTVSGLVYLWLRARFAHNAGYTTFFQLEDQLDNFIHPHKLLFATEDTYGIRLLMPFTVAPMALLIWTIVRVWRKLPLPVRRHAQIAAIINIPLYLLFCNANELRDLSMLYPIFLLIVAWNLKDWMERTAAQPAQ
ncbi:MAG TPA: hypothetical protein VG893_02225 [Terracidiphilus sp.]|nr:hypothetical protein [Terracidiphilus sp.]